MLKKFKLEINVERIYFIKMLVNNESTEHVMWQENVFQALTLTSHVYSSI